MRTVQRPFRLGLVAVVAALVAGACAADGSTVPGDAAPVPTTAAPVSDGLDGGSSPSATTTTTVAAGTGNEVPDSLRFTAAGVGGTEIDFAQYAGTPVVLWFWAPG